MVGKHTPGPWAVNGGDDVWIGNRTCVHIGDEDDARLIAAAPELLEALISVDDFIRGKPEAVEPFGIVRAAIAKATGGQE